MPSKEKQRAESRKEPKHRPYRGDKPHGVYYAPLDLVEDRMRTRVVGVAALFCIYLIVGDHIFISSLPENPFELTARVTFASALPYYGSIGNALTSLGAPPVAINVISSEGLNFYERRCPALGDICDTNGSATAPVLVTASVDRISYATAPHNTLDCSDGPGTDRDRHRQALPSIMIDAPCTPTLRGAVNSTDETGTATFTDLAISSGPAGPNAIYTLAFDGGDNKRTTARTTSRARVQTIKPLEPLVGGDMHVQPNVPFPLQPRVLVQDANDQPVANASVVAFASEHLNFFQHWMAEVDKTDRHDGATLHHVRGQNYALLDGVVSTQTGADGIAEWTNLSVTAAASKYLYLMFYCEGAIASWNDPEMSPPAPGAVPRPQRYVSPIYIDSPIAQVSYLDPRSETDLSTAECPTNADGTPYLHSVREGDRIVDSGAATPRVRLLDWWGQPLQGERVIAVLHTSAGFQLPSLERPQKWRLNEPGYGNRVEPELKQLYGAVSEPSDAEGVAKWPDLAFSLWGKDDGWLSLYSYSRIAFCTPGATSTGTYDGCALSCPFRAAPRTEQLLWSVQPSWLRAASAESAATIQPGEPLAAAPTKPLVRFVDAEGDGVPGKQPLVFVLDLDAVIANCLHTEGLALTDADLLGDGFLATMELGHPSLGGAHLCVGNTIVMMAPHALRMGAGELTDTGGFAQLPTAYSFAATDWMFGGGVSFRMLGGARVGELVAVPGDAHARALAGRIRLVACDTTYSRWTTPSDPIYFSVPAGLFTSAGAASVLTAALEADSASGAPAVASAPAVGPCTTLRPADALSEAMLSYSALAPPALRRPSPLGGVGVAGWTPLFGSTTPTPMETFDSWLVPLTDPFNAAAEGGYRKADVADYLDATPKYTACAGFGAQPDYYDTAGDVASFLGRVRQAVLCDFACDDVATASVTCLDATCVDTPACVRAQWAQSFGETYTHAFYLTAAGAASLGFSNRTNATYLSQVESMRPIFDGTPPGIRLRAVDATGAGVPDLRVALNVLDVQFPHLSPLAGIVTCGLRNLSTDSGTLSIEGLFQSEVDAQIVIDPSGSPAVVQPPCVTDADGYVEMAIVHPFLDELGDSLRLPEFVMTASMGDIPYEYIAYSAVTDASGTFLERACAHDGNLRIDAAVASLEWGPTLGGAADARLTDPVEQQRTAFGVKSNGPVEVAPVRDSVDGYDSSHTAYHLGDGSPMTAYLAVDYNDTLAETNLFCFQASDLAKAGVSSRLSSVDFVHAPSYLPGWTTRPDQTSCSTLRSCGLIYGEPGSPLAGTGPSTAVVNVEEYGLDLASSLGYPRFRLYPHEPFATTTKIQTGSWDVSRPGVGCVGVAIHQGHPGVYGLVLAVDGIRSSPLLFSVPSQLASIAIATQPAGLVTTADGDVEWRVKSRIAQAPVALLSDAAGAPLAHYFVFARAVDPETQQPLPGGVALDMVDGAGTFLEGVFNPTGAARSAPADAAGRALFPGLLLFDAKNGTRFQLEFFFTAVQKHEEIILTGNAWAMGSGTVSAVSPVTFVAINPHKLTATTQPSSIVTQAAPLPVTPSMYYAIELEPFTSTTLPDGGADYTVYRLPEAVLSGILSVQLLPAAYNGARVTPAQQIKYAARVFSGSRCSEFAPVVRGGFSGRCTYSAIYGNDSGTLSSHGAGQVGYVVGGTHAGATLAAAAYAANDWRLNGFSGGVATDGAWVESTAGVPPQWVTTIDFPEFRWRAGSGSVTPAGALEFADALSTPADFTAMTDEPQPATIELLNHLPSDVTVGESFLLRARVTISSGMPLAAASVTVSVVRGEGVVLSPADFITDAFSIVTSTLGADATRLSEKGTTGVTDADGVVNLIVQLVTGTDGDAVALQVAAANGVTSPRSNTMVVSTPMNGMNATNQSRDLTGVNGVGDRGSIAETWQLEGYSSFPIVLALDNVTLSLDVGAAARPVQPGDFLTSTLYFRVFTRTAIDEMREREALLADTAAQASEQAGAAAAGAYEAAETAVTGGTLNQAYLQFMLVIEQLTDWLRVSGEQLIISFVLLLVAGSSPLTAGGATANAYVYPDFTVHVSGAEELQVGDLQMEIGRPGEYYLQPVAGGIPGPLIGPIDVGKYSDGGVGIAVDLGLKIATTVIVATAALGNSDWHDPKFAVPVGLATCGALLGLTAYVYPIDGAYSIGLWYVITLSVMIAFTLVGVFGLLLGKRLPFTKPFAQARRENCFAYCKRLVTAPNSEATELMAQLRESGAHDLATRLYLQKRLELVRRQEKSWATQLKQIGRSVLGKEPTAAFHFPARMYATLVVSLFANTFMMLNVMRLFSKMADGVRAADVRTISAMRSSITTLQAQFRELTDSDLPSDGSDWVEENVAALHAYMVGLADAIEIAAAVACALGIAFYLLAWLTMLLDFRAQVMQARRGIWSFNVAKVKAKFTFTYFGAQISNGMMTFVLISFILFPVVLVLAWDLTWELIPWFIKTFWEWLVILLVPIVVNVVTKMVVTKAIAPKQVILRRFSFMLFDLYQVLLTAVTGIMTALVRFVLVCVVTLFSLPRMDVSIFPAWLDYYIALDSGARAYHSLILVHHMHSNPVMRTFCWILQEDAARRAANEPGMAKPALRRASNMWQKLWIMHKTPSLKDYSASGAPPSPRPAQPTAKRWCASHAPDRMPAAAGETVPLKAVVKAAKKKDVEILRRELGVLREKSAMVRSKGPLAAPEDVGVGDKRKSGGDNKLRAQVKPSELGSNATSPPPSPPAAVLPVPSALPTPPPSPPAPPGATSRHAHLTAAGPVEFVVDKAAGWKHGCRLPSHTPRRTNVVSRSTSF